MILNEEEANKKICCLSKTHNFNDIHVQLCCASHCMAWRWAIEYPFNDKENKKGYCGLAGEP